MPTFRRMGTAHPTPSVFETLAAAL